MEHAITPASAQLLQAFDPSFGKLRVGYIKGHWSKQSAPPVASGINGMETILTTRNLRIRRGITAYDKFGNPKKKMKNNLQPVQYDQTKFLQEYFDELEDFTIDEMDIYVKWEGLPRCVPLRKLSFQPSFSKKTFYGQIPSNELRLLIQDKIRRLGAEGKLDPEVKKRLRGTWLINSTPTGVGGEKLGRNFYDFLFGSAIVGLLRVEEKQQRMTTRELRLT